MFRFILYFCTKNKKIKDISEYSINILEPKPTGNRSQTESSDIARDGY